MHPRAVELLNLLGMRPHPEGGHYVEMFRSGHRVRQLARNVERVAITTIYFLLTAGNTAAGIGFCPTRSGITTKGTPSS